MTWSAPRDRTKSSFAVLHTPVTSAPNALASCTAKLPTPPEAPMTRTRWPGSTLPASVSACSAVPAEIGTTAAWSNVRFAGLRDSLSSRTAAYSAKDPRRDPEHLVAGREPGHRRTDTRRPCRRRRGRAPGSSVRGGRSRGRAGGRADPPSCARFPGRGRPPGPARAPRRRRAAVGGPARGAAPRPTRTCPGRSPAWSWSWGHLCASWWCLSRRWSDERVSTSGAAAATT